MIIGQDWQALETHAKAIHAEGALGSTLPAYAKVAAGFRYLGNASTHAAADQLAVMAGVSGTFQSRGGFKDEPGRIPRFFVLHG